MKITTLLNRRSIIPVLLILGSLAGLVQGASTAQSPRWVGTWATSPLFEQSSQGKVELADTTLRQVVHVSIGGRQLRVRFSNAFGSEPLVLNGVHVAVAGPGGTIQPETDRALRFAAETSVVIPPGAVFVSDPVEFALVPLSDLAVTTYVKTAPAILTLHPGSRATSYLKQGGALAAASFADATQFVRWYFINEVEVLTEAPDASTVVVLGDSITDGRGSITDQNNRWTDLLARRLQARPETANIGVLNQGIGGNRLLRDGLGPNALARFDRDVLSQPGVRWLVVFEGINDIGTRSEARTHGEGYASAVDIIAAYEQIIVRAHEHGIRVYGATITPYAGADFYWTADGEADRETINRWIRTSGRFDAVIDFDATLRDAQEPTHLARAYDSGDHLHPSVAGYEQMAQSLSLDLFAP